MRESRITRTEAEKLPIEEYDWRGHTGYRCTVTPDCRFDSLNREKVVQHLSRVHRIRTHVLSNQAAEDEAELEAKNGEADADENDASEARGSRSRGNLDSSGRDEQGTDEVQRATDVSVPKQRGVKSSRDDHRSGGS